MEQAFDRLFHRGDDYYGQADDWVRAQAQAYESINDICVTDGTRRFSMFIMLSIAAG